MSERILESYTNEFGQNINVGDSEKRIFSRLQLGRIFKLEK